MARATVVTGTIKRRGTMHMTYAIPSETVPQWFPKEEASTIDYDEKRKQEIESRDPEDFG